MRCATPGKMEARHAVAMARRHADEFDAHFGDPVIDHLA